MDYFFVIFGFILLFTGLAGCFLPAVPGPPLSYVGLVLVSLASFVDMTPRLLIFWAVVTVLVTLLDYFIPVYGAKRFGGTKMGMIGAMLGLLIGIFVFPPFGLIIGPLVGALIGELIAGQKQQAFRSALGTFLGFLTGLVLKVIVCLIMVYYSIIYLPW
ncbi:MAG: DUF456 domain-containing protein [Candidatus Cyclobacteriaceae bacterium M2_1C_046]